MARRFQQALIRDTVDTTTELVAEEGDPHVPHPH